ncbi:MAG: hypothetical protein KBT11_09220 [Treponema sp.]|nr:hypothetical protein [Candidatus Treponema equifaecale]
MFIKKIVSASIFTIFVSVSAFSQNNEMANEDSKIEETAESQIAADTRLAFPEIWGYVMTGRENEFNPDYPITDVGYFISAVNTFSDIPKVPEKAKYFSNYGGKVHLVTSCDSKSQTHLLLDPKLSLRNKIIKQLIEASKTYDGLQIDWELVPADDWENYFNFLKILKKKLRKGQTLSVAISARVKTLEKDAYDYARLSKVADKIIIMAYDQHWSTSAPGPIASPTWGTRIFNYAKDIIPEEKLVFGAPFYSRAWTNEDIGAKAWKNRSVENLLEENKVQPKDILTDEEGNKYFKLKKERTITVYFDDTETSVNRLKVYKDIGINRIAFWRVGQENEDFWENLKIELK